jgi:preprotein translocase subunit SecE
LGARCADLARCGSKIMNAKVEEASSVNGADIAKLVLAAVVLIGGIAGFYYYADVAKLGRVFGLIVAFVASAAIVAITGPGRNLRGFLVESNFELRKVVWPSKDETIRATGVIAIVVLIISLILGLIDLTLKVVVMDWLLKLGV